MSEGVRRVSVRRVERLESQRLTDMVAVEEPLEIRIRYWFKDTPRTESLVVTMRTPGHDRELAAGFLHSEGVVKTHRDIAEIRTLGSEPSNEILVELIKEADFEAWRMARANFVNSSCGICGKRTLESIDVPTRAAADDAFSVSASLLHKLPALLAQAQKGFAQTGGLHAAALLSAGGDIELGAVFEDIGRHNALDKLIGSCLLRGSVPLSDRILFLSSRSSFELVQKAALAGAPMLATVGSPSSLAIESAQRYGLTLIGFVRNERFNIYSGDWRIR